jgi:hypothetical protein
LRPNCVLERVENSTRVWVVIRIFRVSPNIKPDHKEVACTYEKIRKMQEVTDTKSNHGIFKLFLGKEQKKLA